MTDAPNPAPDAGRRLSRRHLLFGGAAAGLGAAGAITAGVLTTRDAPGVAADGTAPAGRAPAARAADGATVALNGAATVPFHGTHQAGITVVPQSHATHLALDLLPGTDRDALRRLLRILTDDAARLTQGASALADSEPELAAVPARLTVTVGFGPELVARAGGAAPSWLRPLPAFGIDRLEEAWSGGDLLLIVAADDPLTVAHATRMLLKDTRSFATLRWTQAGFRRAPGSERPGTTMRNLFGQVDGTVNPQPAEPDFDELVWSRGEPAWLAGGTSFVLRRIRLDLDKWDRLDRSGREQSVGRTLAVGAPLTGTAETDEPDFEAKTAIGFPVIPEFSHIRRARSENPAERIHRRGYNYDDAPLAAPPGAPDAGGSVSNSGMLFGSYQADVDAQFVPIQRRLDELDLLNEWTTPIGSAVFAIPPGCAEGGYLGETLLA
jgi:dye decolorizing peroxidase